MAFNVSPSYLKRIAQLESGGDPLAMNPNSTAKGLYQFTDPVAAEYGLSDPTDPEAATDAVKTLTSDNYKSLKASLGRPPTEAELYLAHQQGAAGAAKLLKNPDKTAADVVGLKQVKNNGGDPSMTAGDFANLWKSKYDGTASEDHTFDPIGQFADSGQIMNDAAPDFSAHAEPVENAPDFSAQSVGSTPEAASNFKKTDNVAEPQTGKLRTGIDSFNQGTMAGWGSDITDPLAALYAVLKTDPMGALKGQVNDPAMAENITNLRGNSIDTLAAGRSANPGTAAAAQILGTLTGAAGMSKVIPSGVATRAATIARAAPNLTAAAIGGGGAVVNALGEAPQDGVERFNNLGWNVPLGAGAGLLGYQSAKLASKGASLVADRLGSPIKNTLTSVGKKLGILDDVGMPPPTPPTGPAAPPLDLSPTKVAGILDEEDAAKLAQGRVLPMTAGERTQNVKLQRMEEIAKKSGSLPFQKAVAKQQDAAYKPLTSILGDAQQIDPIALNYRTQDEMNNAANLLRGQYDNLGKQVNQAYKTASEGANGVGIRASNISNDFLGGVGDMMAMENVRPGDIPKLDSTLDELRGIISPMHGDERKPFSPDNMNLRDLEAWKKRLNRAIGNTMEPADKRIMQAVSRHYDDFLGNLADDAIVNGDETAINAFKNARGLASQKFKFYNSDTSIQKILDNRELSGTQLVNTILGANKMVGKGDDGRIVETMLNLAGDKAPDMQNAMRRGVMAKVLNDSLSSTTDATTVGTAAERKLLDFGKMKKSLGSLMQQRETFGALFDDSEQSYFKQMYKDIDQIASKQPGAVNNSSTGAYMADMVHGISKLVNNPLFAKMSLGGTHYLQKGLEAHAASIVMNKSEKGLDEFLANAFKQVDAPAVFYGGYVGSQAMDPIGNATGSMLFGGNNDSNRN